MFLCIHLYSLGKVGGDSPILSIYPSIQIPLTMMERLIGENDESEIGPAIDNAASQINEWMTTECS